MRFGGTAPEGWSPIAPAEAGEGGASAVWVRDAELHSERASTITVLERMVSATADLEQLADDLLAVWKAEATELTITRAEHISIGTYGMDVEYATADVAALLRKTYLSIAVPSTEGSYLLEFVLDTPFYQHTITRTEFSSFIKSISVQP
ncbi:hypothetical protein [Mycobacteroides salmoniphilum]|uniref:hypothetical protein n=1 Tax=Mycobacteroides salmoniphilum TaxID=404941 RepID=UPI00099436C4|nr:hypothetical protein [Mycobacteroides salmoniphilum]